MIDAIRHMSKNLRHNDPYGYGRIVKRYGLVYAAIALNDTPIDPDALTELQTDLCSAVESIHPSFGYLPVGSGKDNTHVTL